MPRLRRARKEKTSVVTWLITVLIGFWAIGHFSNDPANKNTLTSKRTPSPKEIALDKVKLKFTWNKAGFDNIMEANFTITNNSQYQIKDIEVTCIHYAMSDTRVDSNDRIIYDFIPEYTTKLFEQFNMGFIHTQAEKTNCSVTDLKVNHSKPDSNSNNL